MQRVGRSILARPAFILERGFGILLPAKGRWIAVCRARSSENRHLWLPSGRGCAHIPRKRSRAATISFLKGFKLSRISHRPATGMAVMLGVSRTCPTAKTFTYGVSSAVSRPAAARSESIPSAGGYVSRAKRYPTGNPFQTAPGRSRRKFLMCSRRLRRLYGRMLWRRHRIDESTTAPLAHSLRTLGPWGHG
jgi:hypothetical protein